MGKEACNGDGILTDKTKKTLRPQVLLPTDLEHPVILVAKKLTGFLPQKVTKDNSLALFHVFFQ